MSNKEVRIKVKCRSESKQRKTIILGIHTTHKTHTVNISTHTVQHESYENKENHDEGNESQ